VIGCSLSDSVSNRFMWAAITPGSKQIEGDTYKLGRGELGDVRLFVSRLRPV
jgi:hypothetical protein